MQHPTRQLVAGCETPCYNMLQAASATLALGMQTRMKLTIRCMQQHVDEECLSDVEFEKCEKIPTGNFPPCNNRSAFPFTLQSIQG